jgi:hypothetical protein
MTERLRGRIRYLRKTVKDEASQSSKRFRRRIRNAFELSERKPFLTISKNRNCAIRDFSYRRKIYSTSTSRHKGLRYPVRNLLKPIEDNPLTACPETPSNVFGN